MNFKRNKQKSTTAPERGIRAVVNVVEIDETPSIQMFMKKKKIVNMFKNRYGFLILFVVISALVLITDTISKNWAISHFASGTTKVWGPITFMYVQNDGAAFGAIPGYTIYLGIFAALMVIGMLLWLIFAKNRTILETFSLGLVAGGALGNMFDRFNKGYVVDFINVNFIDFPVFNIADICITCGCILLVIGTIIAIVRGPKEYREKVKESKKYAGGYGAYELSKKRQSRKDRSRATARNNFYAQDNERTLAAQEYSNDQPTQQYDTNAYASNSSSGYGYGNYSGYGASNNQYDYNYGYVDSPSSYDEVASSVDATKVNNAQVYENTSVQEASMYEETTTTTTTEATAEAPVPFGEEVISVDAKKADAPVFDARAFLEQHANKNA